MEHGDPIRYRAEHGSSRVPSGPTLDGPRIPRGHAGIYLSDTEATLAAAGHQKADEFAGWHLTMAEVDGECVYVPARDTAIEPADVAVHRVGHILVKALRVAAAERLVIGEDEVLAALAVEGARMLARIVGQAQGRSCRVCGCTDGDACDDEDTGSCWWVEHDLCSSCRGKDTADAVDGLAAHLKAIDDLVEELPALDERVEQVEGART